MGMVQSLPPLNALRAFEVAGRHGSFARAAEELSVSHSAISRHVRALEHRLGVQLFRNLPRGVALTAEGQAYLARVLPAIEAIAAATEALTQVHAGQLTVSTENLFAVKVLAPLLVQFHGQFPAIDVRLDVSDTMADLERYEADFAIRFQRVGQPELPFDVLSTAPLFPFAAPALAPEGALSPQQIADLPRFRDRGEDIWPQWAVAAGHPGLLPSDGTWRPKAAVAMEMAAQGGGVYLGSGECAALEVGLGRLVQVSEVPLVHGAYYLVQGHRGARSTAARQFRTWLLAQTAPFRAYSQPMG